MSRQLFRGVILAAGRGERLSPLTTTTPKPLLPFAGIELLTYAAYALQQAGLSRVIVNAHHLGEQVIAYCQGNPLGLEIAISDERRELLGTGGAIGAMHGLRDHCSLVVINGDVITNFPVSSLLGFHQQEGVVASMALLPQPHPREAKVWCHRGRVLAIGGEEPPVEGATPHGFACLQVLAEEFLQMLPSGKAYGIMDYYRLAIAKGMPIGGYIHEAFWFDIGNPAAYLQAHHAVLKWWAEQPFSAIYDPLGIIALQKKTGKTLRFIPPHQGGPSLIADDQHLGPHINLGPFVVVDRGCTIRAGATVREAILFSKSSVAESQTIVRAILTPTCQINC